MKALASTLDDEELANLRDQFNAIDVDKNGSISLEEMKQVGQLRSIFSLALTFLGETKSRIADRRLCLKMLFGS